MKKRIIAITMGDPGGVGPEVIAKALSNRKLSNKLIYLLIGARGVFEYLNRSNGPKLELNPIPAFNPFFKKRVINFLDITSEARKRFVDPKEKSKFERGKLSRLNAALAFQSLETATGLAERGFLQALVTAPVNKTAIRLVHTKFDGHTDYLAWKSKAKKYAMMFVGKKLKVTLATIHIPLKKVPGSLTKKNILEKIELTNNFIKRYFRVRKPKIAVCALNPHGEEMGDEENKIIRPAIQAAVKKQIKAVGPFSGDTLFYTAAKGNYDAVISMFHDQGLAPFKMLYFEEGVNTTLGLPYVRTSPDHGTAFDIAYKNKADKTSMDAAISLAEKLIS